MADSQALQTRVLLSRYRAGDAAALQTLFERYYPRIDRIVRVRLRVSAVREAALRYMDEADVVQQVFLRILKSARGYENRDDATWISYVSKLVENEIANLARNAMRKKRGGPSVREVRLDSSSGCAIDVARDASSISGKLVRAEEEELLDRLLSELSESHRDVILHRSYAGCDWESVAELMGKSTVEACQEMHRRARTELARKIRAAQG